MSEQGVGGGLHGESRGGGHVSRGNLQENCTRWEARMDRLKCRKIPPFTPLGAHAPPITPAAPTHLDQEHIQSQDGIVHASGRRDERIGRGVGQRLGDQNTDLGQ